MTEQAGFIIGGHSHKFALGAPRGHQGGLALAPVRLGARDGFFAMSEKPGARPPEYWDLIARSGRDRDVYLTWLGNHHFILHLFRPQILFDFYDPFVPGGAEIQPGAMPLARRMILARFEGTVADLGPILASIRANGPRSLSLVATPPPRRDIAQFEERLRASREWGDAATRAKVDLSTAEIMPAPILLKLWSVMQELVRAVCAEAGAVYVPVPAAATDEGGFLRPEYCLAHDFTHANDAYGRVVTNELFGAGAAA